MKFFIEKKSPESFKTDLIAVFCHEKSGFIEQIPILKQLDKSMNGELLRQASTEKFRGKKESSLMIFTAGRIPARHILLVGMGVRTECKIGDFREAGVFIIRTAQKIKATDISICLEKEKDGDLAVMKTGAISEGAVLGGYRFDRYKNDDEDRPPPIHRVSYLHMESATGMKSAIDKGIIVADATCAARDLVNSPACDATPGILAKSARKIASAGKLACSILKEAEIRKAKMNCLLAVARGSAEPPSFITLTYKPGKKTRKHIAIVGKGITFDSGGISLKPPRGMAEMKSDMAGAAVVLATMKAVAELKPNVRITGIIPAAENLPGGRALKPGDIITARNGKTIEIISTDAEGRLVLADALSYAADMKPDIVIDLATLTGGAAYCCGELYSLVMGNDQKLVDGLMTASKSSGEPAWQLPMVEEYKKGYTSGIADLNNNGKGKAQTILGAIFLREFVNEIPWAHIDIAASSWTDENLPLSPKGATGTMVRTMIEFLMSY